MLSRETLEAYRKMTPSERLALTLQAMRDSFPYLLEGPAEVVDRKFELIRRENDARTARCSSGWQPPREGMQTLDEAARDFIALFERMGIPYAVMGGMAVRIYALPRPTFDVDFTVAYREKICLSCTRRPRTALTVPRPGRRLDRYRAAACR